MTLTNLDVEQQIWERWNESHDSEAGDILVKKYLPLVHFHAQRISVGLPRNVQKEDLISLGMLGLLDALHKFDVTRDLKFDTYASFRIRGAILDGLRKEDWLPRRTREKAKKIEAMAEKLEQSYGRHATPEELAIQLEVPLQEVLDTMHQYQFASILSIEEHYDKDDKSDYTESAIPDYATLEPEQQLIKIEELSELTNQISQLNEKEQLIISLFYHEELTFTEIGQLLDLSTSRISQIHSKILFKLRKVLMKTMSE